MTLTNPYLVYIAADGSAHYFQKSGSTYYDEDGLGRTITVSGVTYTMKDSEKNTWVFYNGYLTSYTDNNGNSLYYAYNETENNYYPTTWKPTSGSTNQLTAVYRKNSGATNTDKLVSFSYTSSGVLEKIEDQAGRVTRFIYDETNPQLLISVEYPDGNTANYSYKSCTVYTGSTFWLMTDAEDNESSYRIHYTWLDEHATWWNSLLKLMRIYEIHEYAGNTAGQGMRAYKMSGTMSTFRYFGADCSPDNSDDTVSNYYFDNTGKTVNITNFNTDRSNIFGVSVGRYTKNEGTSKKNNRLTAAASSGIKNANLLLNSGVEGTRTQIPNTTSSEITSWARLDSGAGNSGARASSATTTNILPRTGGYLMKLYMAATTSGREARYQDVYLEVGKTYVFSAYVNTACANSFGSDGGAYLSVQTADGTEQKRSRIINYKTSTAGDRGWERLETVFTAENAGVYSLYVNMYHMSNVVVFDDFQLEEVFDLTSETVTSEGYKADGTASTVNLLQAGSFDARNTSGVTICSAGNYWSYSNSIAAPELTSSRGCVMAFTPSVTALRHVSQTVNLNCSSNTTFLLSAWGLAPASNIGDESALTEENSEKKRFFGMIAKIIYSDTTMAEYQYVSFNDDVGEWQYACGTIVPKREDKTIASITVYLASDLNPNTAYIDEVSLVQEPVQTYSYDDNGNLLVATNSEGKTSTEYDSSERLKKYTTMSGVVYNLTYSGTSRDVQKITSDGVQTTYTYNAAGEVTQTQTKPTSGNLYLQSSAEYSTDKNFKTSATDVNGSVTKASHNSAKGLVTDTTAANNTKTFYVYNAYNDRQTMSYISDVAATHDSYNENGLLSHLARKSFYGTSTLWQAYDFHYNEWGQTLDISVRRTDTTDGTGYSDGLTLAQYDYADHGGNLIKMTYGNGQFVTYEYDLFDRLVHTVYYTSSNTVQAEYYYVYNSEGALAKQYAVSNGSVTEEYSFEYDSLGRLIRSRETDADGTVTQRTEHLYDEANRLTKQAWTLGTNSFTETYTYNSGDGSLNTVTTAQIGSVANSYDSLKRLTEQIYATKTGVNYGRWYTYADSGNDASSRVSSFAYRSGSTSTGALLAGSSYSYNTDGTISAITDLSTGAQVTYTYDVQGQLTDEYRYNSAGTLQSHDHYLYDTAGNLRETVHNDITESVYSYDNAQWQDLLTSYNGVEIGYEGQTYNWRTGEFSGEILSGNPLNWYNGQEYYELTWSQGRRLTYLEVFGADQQYRIDYVYDMEGVRSQKLELSRNVQSVFPLNSES